MDWEDTILVFALAGTIHAHHAASALRLDTANKVLSVDHSGYILSILMMGWLFPIYEHIPRRTWQCCCYAVQLSCEPDLATKP